METIKIKYHTDEIDKIKEIAVGDWIDLRAAETTILHKGDFKLISLGVSMKLPEGYEAHVVPRSSTFKDRHLHHSTSRANNHNGHIYWDLSASPSPRAIIPDSSL